MTPNFAWVALAGWSLAGLGVAAALVWLVGRRSRGGKRCPWCDYDLSATAGTLCPECGREWTEKQARRRRMRRHRWALLALAFGALGAGALVFNPARRDGWATGLPTWAARLITPWCESLADAPIQRLTGGSLLFPGGPAVAAFAGGYSTPASRWERLLIVERCRTVARKIEELTHKPQAERMPPRSALDDTTFPSTPAQFEAYYEHTRDPLQNETERFIALLNLTAADNAMLAPDLHRVMETARAVGDGSTWWWGMRALRRIGNVDAQTQRLILSMLKDADATTRTFGLSTLVETKKLETHELVAALVSALDDPDPGVRLNVVGWLGKMGPDAGAAVARLRRTAASDQDDWVKSAAPMAIKQIETAR